VVRHSSSTTVAHTTVLRLITASFCALFAGVFVSAAASLIEFDSAVGAGTQSIRTVRFLKTFMIVVIEDGIRIYSVLFISVVHKCQAKDAALAFAFVFNSLEFIPRAFNDFNNSHLTGFDLTIFLCILFIAFFTKLVSNFYLTFAEYQFFDKKRILPLIAVFILHAIYNFGIFYQLGALRFYIGEHYIPFFYGFTVIVASLIFSALLRFIIIRLQPPGGEVD
jgi:hypothetical protein